MSSEIIKTEDNEITLKVVIEAEQFEKSINQAYNKMKSQFNIQGFRKGKTPRKIVEKYYGAEIFYEEAFNLAFPEAYEAALEKHDIDPVDHPDIDIEDINKGENVVFTAKVEVMPEFEITDYKGIEVKKEESNVQEEDIQKQLDALLEQNARMISVEGREVKKDDMVIIDYKGMIDGVPFEGGTAERHNLTIGSGQFIPGFEEQLIGKDLGEVEVAVTFPEEYHAEDLAGKEAIFEVVIHEIKEKELPKLDDEFVKDISEFDTLEEFKNDIRVKMEEHEKNKVEQELKDNIIEAISDKVEIKIPEAVTNRQINNMLMDFDYRLQSQGINLEYYFQMTNTSEADLREQMKEEAMQTIKNQLMLEKIASNENIQVTDEELDEQLENMAKQYNQELEGFKSKLAEKDLDYIKEGIVIRKTIDFLVENAKIK